MKKEGTVAFLKAIGAQHIQPEKRSGWVISRCPLEHWRHEGGVSGPEVFGFETTPGNARGNCFSCGWHGSMSDLVLTMRHHNKAEPVVSVKWGEALAMVERAEIDEEFNFDLPDIEEVLFGEKAQPHIFPDWWVDSFPSWRDAPLAVQYLEQRWVPAEIADRLEIRFDTEQRRVCFPVRDFSKRLRGLHGRAIDEDTDPRYRMYRYAKRNCPEIWLGESWVDLTKPIVVVEGPFDLTSVMRVYPNVVCPLFATPSLAKLRRMNDALDWITLLDRGKGGDTGREKVEKALTSDHIVTHLQPPRGARTPASATPRRLSHC
jgi:hypothetical protein